MAIFNALLNLRELKELYSGKPVCVCPLYKGVINATKIFEATGNPIVIPEYKSLVKLKTAFLPKQAGEGNPSPDNVRPISGYDSVTVTQSKDEAQVKQITLTLPETIYGGTVDAVTGEGEKTWEFVEFDGSEDEHWLKAVHSSSRVYFYINIIDYGLVFDIESVTWKCNRLVPSVYNYASNKNPEYSIGFTSLKYLCTIVLENESMLSVDEFKAWLAENPVTVCYELATPKPFKVSQVSIPSLKGENTFFTNGENMDIIYKKESFWGDEA